MSTGEWAARWVEADAMRTEGSGVMGSCWTCRRWLDARRPVPVTTRRALRSSAAAWSCTLPLAQRHNLRRTTRTRRRPLYGGWGAGKGRDSSLEVPKQKKRPPQTPAEEFRQAEGAVCDLRVRRRGPHRMLERSRPRMRSSHRKIGQHHRGLRDGLHCHPGDGERMAA